VFECDRAILEVFHWYEWILMLSFFLADEALFLFVDGRWRSAVNYMNPLGSQGKLAGAFAKLLHEMWGGDLPYLSPIDFRVGSRILFLPPAANSFYLYLFAEIDMPTQISIQRIGPARLAGIS
jgi:hypothetical protein